jgi:hypothetical protein
VRHAAADRESSRRSVPDDLQCSLEEAARSMIQVDSIRRRAEGPALPRWASTDKIAMVSDHQPIRPYKKEPHFCQ